MNLKRAYLLLCGFYTLLILIGAIALLAGGGSLLAAIQLGIGALVVIGLWGYFLGRGFMNPRMWRPLAGLLAVGIVIQLIAVFTAHLSATAMTWTLTTAIFSVLPMIFLYRYGDRDQSLWATPEEREGGKMLGELLERQRELWVEKQAADSQATVKVSKMGDAYLASVERERDGSIEAFEERFRCPATLAFFIEKFTCLSVSDFVSKYRDNDVNPA
ncbi:hypothetical protein FHR95_002080 [Halomonas fontilapidosi]|uniref:Uncharacterized protein n=1 Tax=Halomonas fontilapidosi TaxID=616675 RepID=A0A7W5DKA6_9GAMM|nr:hypothetical protein [Halomonas fontilapidosi]MBB3184507.1 hypothetical protein [Halomonas fontilapidosi]